MHQIVPILAPNQFSFYLPFLFPTTQIFWRLVIPFITHKVLLLEVSSKWQFIAIPIQNWHIILFFKYLRRIVTLKTRYKQLHIRETKHFTNKKSKKLTLVSFPLFFPLESPSPFFILSLSFTFSHSCRFPGGTTPKNFRISY